eukprot:3135214-Pyramimonas_sp.AAC.1
MSQIMYPAFGTVLYTLTPTVPMQMLGGGPSMADETGEVAFVYSFMASLEVSRGKPADSV